MPSPSRKLPLPGGGTITDIKIGTYEQRSERYDYANYECGSFKSSADKPSDITRDVKVSINLNSLGR